MSVTHQTARQEIANRASEFIQGTDGGGTTTTIVDTTNLNFAQSYWNESTVLVTSGGASGATRRVVSYSGSTLALYNALGSSPSGATYELYRRFSPTDYKTAINRSLNIGAPDFRERVRAVATCTADTLQYAFPTVPELGNMGLVRIEYQRYTNANQGTWPYQQLSPDEYEIIENYNATRQANDRLLQLRFNPVTNRLLRFIFDGPIANVAADSDIIHLDLPELEWLYTQGVAELWRIESSRTVDATRKEAIENLAHWEVTADGVRRRLGIEPAPRPLRRTKFSTFYSGQSF